MHLITQLKLLLDNKNWQKLCVGEDYSNTAFKFVLNKIFCRPISYHRKQWEFVVIFINLALHNKLNGQANGASFGAGKEALIYDLLPYTKSFLATDLYSLTTGWNTARLGQTDTPESFLTKNAPVNLDLSNLKALDMDMRYLDIKDNSLDFCYSSCAIEHIGERKDFIKHLKEVRRVLKDDGIYVVTTEIAFSKETIPVKGNYKFDINYLKELFVEAGLDTLPEFDGLCERSRINAPRPYLQPLVGGKNIDKIMPMFIMWEIEGITYTSCCFVLSPSKQSITKSFEESGLSISTKYVNNRAKFNIEQLYMDPRALNPFAGLSKGEQEFIDDHIRFRVSEEKQPITLSSEKFCFTKYIWFDSNTVHFNLLFNISGIDDEITFQVLSKDKMLNSNRELELEKKIKVTNSSEFQELLIKFDANTNKVYAIVGQVNEGWFQLKRNSLKINHLDVNVQIIC